MKTRLKNKINEGFYNSNDELTRYAFISHMKSYIRQLLNKPTQAHTDDFLKSFGITTKKALEIVLDKNKPYGPLVKRIENIKTDEDGKDRFYIKYIFLNTENNFYEKMKKLYKKYVDDKNDNNTLIKEEGEGIAGATSCNASSGQYSQPLSKPIKRKSIYITQEQADYLKEAIQLDTIHGNFGYDAPGLSVKNNDPSMSHKNMIISSRKINESYDDGWYEDDGKNIIEGIKIWSLSQIYGDQECDRLSYEGIIPEELGGDFDIKIQIDGNHTRFIGCKDYDDAIYYINQIKDKNIKQVALESLNDLKHITADELDSYEVIELDIDDIYQDYFDKKNDR